MGDRAWVALAVLGLTAGVILGTPMPCAAQIVRGTVLETGTRRPIMLARVGLLDTTFAVVDETLSEDDGAFTLQAPAPGDYYVVADRLGYLPRIDGILEMGEGGFITVEFFLPARPVELEGITATAERVIARRKLETGGFFEREQRGFGHFIGPEDIARRPVIDASDLFRGVPRVQVVGDPLAGSTVYFRGGRGGSCSPRILVDGVPAPPGLALEDLVSVQDIVGVEVYVGVASAPIEFLSNSNCGVLLIWTG